VTRYEIWNEQNASRFWHPQEGGAETYADLYLATRQAIRAVDPAARVMIGGLALSNVDVTDESAYVEAMYAHRPDLRGNVDAIGFHPYTATADQAIAKIAQFRSTLDRLGARHVPLEVTEVGWTTTKTNDQERAAALRQLAEQLPDSGCNVQSLLPYVWRTSESDPADPEDWFGIANADGSLKPSGRAYLEAVSRMRSGAVGPPPQRCDTRALRRGPAVRIRVLRKSRRRARLVARLRCPSGCRLTVELMRRSRGHIAGTRRVARRRLAFSARRRTVRLPLRTRRGVVELRVQAVDRRRGVTERKRLLKVRCRRSRRRGHSLGCRLRPLSSRRHVVR
jgi:hypothetical protein